jgi:hypothetical protein
VEGMPGWLVLAVFACYGLMGLSLLPAFAAGVLLLARRPQQALKLFATALLCEAVVWAAWCFLIGWYALTRLSEMTAVGGESEAGFLIGWSVLTGLSLLLAGSGQFVGALRSPRTYAMALAFAVAAVLVQVAQTPIVYRLGLSPPREWTGMPVAVRALALPVTSLALAVTSLMSAVLVPFDSRRRERERHDAGGRPQPKPR